MALIRLVAEGVWEFLKGKYAGKSIDQVAEDDPGYLSWAWRETSGDASPDQFFALDDAARRHDIDVERGKKADNNSFRKQRITHDRSRKRR